MYLSPSLSSQPEICNEKNIRFPRKQTIQFLALPLSQCTEVNIDPFLCKIFDGELLAELRSATKFQNIFQKILWLR